MSVAPDGLPAEELAPIIVAVWQSLRSQGLTKRDQMLVLHVLTTRTDIELPDEAIE